MKKETIYNVRMLFKLWNQKTFRMLFEERNIMIFEESGLSDKKVIDLAKNDEMCRHYINSWFCDLDRILSVESVPYRPKTANNGYQILKR